METSGTENSYPCTNSKRGVVRAKLIGIIILLIVKQQVVTAVHSWRRQTPQIMCINGFSVPALKSCCMDAAKVQCMNISYYRLTLLL